MQTQLDDAKKELVDGEEILWHGRGSSRFLMAGIDWFCLGFALFQIWSFFQFDKRGDYSDLTDIKDKVMVTITYIAYGMIPVLFLLSFGVAYSRKTHRPTALYVLTNQRVMLFHKAGIESASYKVLKAVYCVRHRGGQETLIFEPARNNAGVNYEKLAKAYRFRGGGGQLSFPVIEDASEAKAILGRIVPDKLDGEFAGVSV